MNRGQLQRTVLPVSEMLKGQQRVHDIPVPYLGP